MTTDRDDWDAHWSNYGDTSGGLNPANRMREATILSLLGQIAGGSTLLDIGSGQGDLAFLLAKTYPGTRAIGVENSTEGVARARRKALEQGVDVSFIERNLLDPVPEDEAASVQAQYAVCSEVLEHVDDPDVLLRHAAGYLTLGAVVVITVPGGPRSAFDRHIGHRRHFTPDSLASTVRASGLEVIRTARTGFPFFNLYKSLVIARGQRVIGDVEQSEVPGSTESLAARIALKTLDALFRFNAPAGRLGWQIVGIARKN